MKIKPISFCAGLMLCAGASAQIYVDPLTSAAMASGSALLSRDMSSTSEKLSSLQRAQLTISAELAAANTIQNQLYRGLSEVSSALSSLLAISDIYAISGDITDNLSKAIALGASSPVLLLFAEGGAKEFSSRAVRLSTQVSSFVLKSGGDNLMDSGERAKLLGMISTQLAILRGIAYGMYRSMYWAKQRGLLNALNPYASFINLDRKIADDILSKQKQLKK
ncbi:hypothetical protein ACJVDH_15200 [Pedobacter sp. AW1-32]|uniref:hypothetical protein n=1 Tax=Pedobacter sp. AW1-32 TaxID=3383026 RepID=UPI003FEEB36B